MLTLELFKGIVFHVSCSSATIMQTGDCLVLTVDGSTAMVPEHDLLHRQPIALVPMP